MPGSGNGRSPSYRPPEPTQASPTVAATGPDTSARTVARPSTGRPYSVSTARRWAVEPGSRLVCSRLARIRRFDQAYALTEYRAPSACARASASLLSPSASR